MREVGFYLTGEPLMNRNICEFVSFAKELGYTYIYMTTNGTLANIDVMKKLVMAGLDSINFSVNAATPETYKKIHGRDEFNQVMVNLAAISEYIKT